MADNHEGVQSRIPVVQPKALYVHCFAHSLNPSVQDSIQCVPLFRDALQRLPYLATVTTRSSERVLAFCEIANVVDTWNKKFHNHSAQLAGLCVL